MIFPFSLTNLRLFFHENSPQYISFFSWIFINNTFFTRSEFISFISSGFCRFPFVCIRYESGEQGRIVKYCLKLEFVDRIVMSAIVNAHWTCSYSIRTVVTLQNSDRLSSTSHYHCIPFLDSSFNPHFINTEKKINDRTQDF